jgi:iron complex outermembrane receptor protein
VSNATFGKGGAFLLPPSSPFYPTAFVVANGGDPTLGVNTRWRALDAGLRTDVATSEQWRVVGGFQGVIKGWDYALAYAYNESTIEDNYTKGYLSEDILVPILNSGVVNPFALNTAAVNALIDTSQITGVLQQAKSTSQIFDAKTSNEIYKLPAGSLALALGYQYERQTLSQTRSDIFASGDIVGGAGAIPSLPEVNRSINSVYAELDVPIIKSVEANLAVRYDNYSDFGSTTNPKIGLRWQPNQQLLFRASWGTGFRAPSLSDLYQPPLITNTAGNHDDPLRCPFTNNASDCETQFNEQQGGNAVLQPEKSTQWGFGGVWEPVNGLSLGADYYNVEIKNLIAVLTDEDLFNNFAFYTAAGFVVRKPPDAAHPGLPGEIDYVITPLTNIGKQTTSGIDINAKYRFPATSAGQFNLAFNGTYIISYKQTDKDNNLVEFVGTRGAIGAISRWRHFVSLDWGYGGWGATVNQTFQNGYQEPWGDTAELPPGTIPPGKSFEDGRRVASYSLWDLQGRYTGFKNTTLALGVKNVLNQDPPTSAINQGFIFGYDSSYGQPFGRFFYGSIRYAFR